MHPDVRILRQQTGDTGFDIGVDIDVAGAQCAGARRVVGNALGHEGLDVAGVLVPVVGELLGHRRQTRREFLQPVRAGAHHGIAVLPARLHDRGVIVVAQRDGEIGVAAVERDHQHVRPVGLHVDDRRQKRLRRRFGAFLDVFAERIDDVLGVQRLAVVELDALAQLEGPFAGVVGRFPLDRQVRHDVHVAVQIGQAVVHLIGALDVRAVGHLRRIEGLLRSGVFRGHVDLAALDRRLRHTGARQHAAGRRRGHAQGPGPADELATVHAARLHPVDHPLEPPVVHRSHPPSCIAASAAPP